MVAGILGGAVGGATVSIIIRAIDQYSKQFKKLDRSVKKQEKGFKRLGKFLKSTGLGYIALAGAAVGFATVSVKAFLEAEIATQAFNAVLGDTADTMLTDLRRAAQGMASDFDLMNSANKALALGIDRNKLPELLKTAKALGKTTGRTVTQAFEDISIGIGRQSRLILDNLGIILDLDDTYESYAETLGKTKDQLSEFEKKQAVTNRVIEEGEFIMRLMNTQAETHAEKIQRLSATWDNLKVSVGLALVTFADVTVELGKILTAYDLWTSEIESPTVINELKLQFDEWKKLKDQIDEAKAAVEAYKQELQGLATGPFVDILRAEKALAEIDLEIAKEREFAVKVTGEGAAVFRDLAEVNISKLEEQRQLIVDELDVLRAKRDLIQSSVNLIIAERDEFKKTTDEALARLPLVTEKLADADTAYKNIVTETDNWKKANEKAVKDVLDEWGTFEKMLLRITNLLERIRAPGEEKALKFGGVGGIVESFEPIFDKITSRIVERLVGREAPTQEIILQIDSEEISRVLSGELSQKVTL